MFEILKFLLSYILQCLFILYQLFYFANYCHAHVGGQHWFGDQEFNQREREVHRRGIIQNPFFKSR